MAFTYVVNYRR